MTRDQVHNGHMTTEPTAAEVLWRPNNHPMP
jgi:hypothetical protein